MSEKRLILCGGLAVPEAYKLWPKANITQVALGSGRDRVHLKLHHLTNKLVGQTSAISTDLIEIAAYVYAADQLIPRGNPEDVDYGDEWRRQFRFVIPVRRPDLWNQPRILSRLQQTLGFLSEDYYEFHFSKMEQRGALDKYLIDPQDNPETDYKEVVLFSGGLDSFGGAIQEILQGQRKVVLVSHRPSPNMYARQKQLVNEIRDRLPNRSISPLHVAVEVNKSNGFGRETTQRSRSFLFASMAAVVSNALNLNRIRFYENGIISLNLPINPQAVGARATRTTHPKVIDGYCKLFGELFGTSFVVENPYFWKTKADVLREIKSLGFSNLCALTSSCAHPRELTDGYTHCGYCSQCVDRRLNAIAAGYNDLEDPPYGYKSDVVTGPRNIPDITLIESYWRTCLEVRSMSEVSDFTQKFAEIGRVLKFVGLPSAEAVPAIFQFYKRHATDICRAMDQLVKDYSTVVTSRDYPQNSLLGIAVGRSPSANKLSSCTAVSGGLRIDESEFEFSYQGRTCTLGNNKEYYVFRRLARCPGCNVALDSIVASAWSDELPDKRAVQTVVTRLRKKIHKSGVGNITINGDTPGYYKLQLA